MDKEIQIAKKNIVLLFIIAVCVVACAKPYRVNLVGCDTHECPKLNMDSWCGGIENQEKHQQCIVQHSTPEKRNGYTLHFVEFDDQGWLFPDSGKELAQDGNAGHQLDFLIDSLYQEAREAKNGLSLVVYVHGWHHNASYNDGNVISFRGLLTNVKAQEERKPGGGKDVVGIYVGWRGESIDLPLLRYITFWDRKNTALHVAEGSIRELFSRIHEFQKDINTINKDQNKHFVRTLYIGHSFGGEVVYFSIADQLIASIAGEKDMIKDEKVRSMASRQRMSNFAIKEQIHRLNEMERPADMVLLINPAFEAARYEPLDRAANHCQDCVYDRYTPPLLVIVTSDGDTATKVWFPFGRFINSIFERPTSSEEESHAIIRTPGFNNQYVNFYLEKQSTANSKDSIDPSCHISTSIEDFTKNNSYFDGKEWKDRNGQNGGWMRNFCGAPNTPMDGTVLKHITGTDPNAPIWNVRATSDLIANHNDIAEPIFKSFVQQLYHDLVIFQ